MSHQVFYRELAMRCDARSANASDDAHRQLWKERADMHRVWADHYDSWDPVKRRAMDLAAEDQLEELRTGKPTQRGKSCRCDANGCACSVPGVRQDSVDADAERRNRAAAAARALQRAYGAHMPASNPRAREEMIKARREIFVKTSPKSGAYKDEHDDRQDGGQTEQPNARDAMIAQRRNAWKAR